MHLTNVAFPADTYDWIHNRYPTPWTDSPAPAILQLDSAQLHRLSRAAEELFNSARSRLFIRLFCQQYGMPSQAYRHQQRGLARSLALPAGFVMSVLL